MPLTDIHSTKHNNRTIEAIRGIACLFVVLVHAPFPGETGIWIKALARFAVPFFLMNSGWFLWKGSAEGELDTAKKQLRKILKITAFVCVLHIIGNTIVSIIGTGSPVAWLEPHWNLETVRNFILFNRSKVFSSVVYYFFMLIYVYVIFILLRKASRNNGGAVPAFMKAVIVICLAANLYISEFNDMTWYFAGNWLLTGVPFFFTGYFMRDWMEKHKMMKIRQDLLLMIIGVAITVFEIPRGGDNVFLYIGTIITVIPLYHFAACFKGNVPEALVRFGSGYSQKIFIIHCMVYNLLLALAKDAAMIPVVQWCMPFAVIACAFGISWLWNKGQRRNKGNV